MGQVIDITGQRFGRLTVVRHVGTGKKRESMWLCKCDCGNEAIVSKSSLRSGNTRSCGCLRKKGNPTAQNAVPKKPKKTVSVPRKKATITIDRNIPLDAKSLTTLAEAVVILAVKDYRSVYSRYVKRGYMTTDMKGKIFSLQKFFLGDWFKVLSDLDGAVLLERLNNEILEEQKKTRGDFDE